MERIIGLAAIKVRNLDKMWLSEDTSKDTKVLLYETLVLSQLLYNSERWTLKEVRKKKLRVFEMYALCRIYVFTRKDRKRNMDIQNAYSTVYLCFFLFYTA